MKLRIIRLRGPDDGDIYIKEWTRVGWHIEVGLVTVGHVYCCNAPVCQSIVPRAHGVMFVHRHIVELHYIAVDNVNAKFLGDVVDHFTTLEVKAIAKPVRAAHEPGRVEFASRET